MQQAVVLDKIDLKILQVLQENGRLSNVELSERVALSPSPCLRRLKQLEDNGIIRRYAALLSPMSLGLGLQVMIRVTTDKSAQARGEFEGAVRTWTEVFTNMDAFSHFVLDVLLSHNCVLDAKSSFVLKEIKSTTALPLGHLA